MDRWLALALALLALSGGLSGCVSPNDPLGRQDALEETQKRYTDFVRWGELEKAGMLVDPELRDDFLALAKEYEALRITDFETSDIEFGEDGENTSATVSVTYKGYLITTLVERTAREEQDWYRVDGNTWRVRPKLADVLATLGGRIPETAGF